jgi:hypothetical protein
MTEVTLDNATVEHLHEASEYLKLRNEKGKVIGYFVPVESSASKVLGGVKSPLSPEERAERMQEQGGISIKEFWATMRETHPDKFP